MDLQVDLQGCLAGRKDAWDGFVRASAPVIYAAVQRACRSRGSTHQADIDDRTQEVYVRLFREQCKLLRAFDSRRASLATWLSIIARTVVHEHFQRKHMPFAGIDAENLASTMTDGSAPPTSRHEELPVICLDVLTPQQRAIIELLFEQDLSVEQAAARLGVDPQTIRSGKHKALTRLRQVMFQPDQTQPGQSTPAALSSGETSPGVQNPRSPPKKRH